MTPLDLSTNFMCPCGWGTGLTEIRQSHFLPNIGHRNSSMAPTNICMEKSAWGPREEMLEFERWRKECDQEEIRKQ